MKNIKILWIVLTLAALCFTGCSTSTKAVPVRYSFAGSEGGTAALTFVSGKKVGIRLFDCEGVSMPAPAGGTYWESDILFPAEKPLNIRVYIYWNEDQFGERRRGIFKCPPLEPGREYKLWFKGNLKGGSIILTYSNVNELIYASGQPKFEIVHEQEIPPLPKK